MAQEGKSTARAGRVCFELARWQYSYRLLLFRYSCPVLEKISVPQIEENMRDPSVSVGSLPLRHQKLHGH